MSTLSLFQLKMKITKPRHHDHQFSKENVGIIFFTKVHLLFNSWIREKWVQKSVRMARVRTILSL